MAEYTTYCVHSSQGDTPIKNIYASTEAGSLFAAEGDIFTIKNSVKNKVRIAGDGELLIHQSLLAESEDFVLDDGWFHTGDLVECSGDGRFRFVSRKFEMINIGGYKVNPEEIEEQLCSVPGVIDAMVKPRSNRITGNILVAEVVKERKIADNLLEERILEHLNKNLQKWKIPRIFKFVDQVKITGTGKKDRK